MNSAHACDLLAAYSVSGRRDVQVVETVLYALCLLQIFPDIPQRAASFTGLV